MPTDTEEVTTVLLRRSIESLYPEYNDTNNQMIKSVITSLNLAPFTINSDCTDNSKHEVIALTTPPHHKRMLDVNARGIKRVKLNTSVENAGMQSTDCIHLTQISNDISFNEIIRNSTYRVLLGFEEYIHITEEHLDVLNSHWRKRPFMYMATSQLLVGSILVDGGQALLLNGVESYGRYPSIDAHFENVSSTQESSIPQLFSQYPNKLKITKINMDKSEKLTIGSITMNILVISSIRIDDSKLAPEVGPSTKNFTPSKSTRLFLSTTSIKLTNKILKNPDSLILSDPLVHFRQLQSKFHQHSTCSLARCYSVFTSDVTVQPYTIYTLVNNTLNNDTCSIMGSKVMAIIGNSVFEENGILKKEDIKQLLSKKIVKETQVVLNTLRLLELFKDDSELEIIGNASISPCLRSIAISTTNGLKDANENIIKNIWNKFRA